jgi:4-aminobutyrate aminotransferase/(S)-3-amino-2-methylpropionate transaminase
LKELDQVLDSYSGKVAGIIVEPIQSEGGDRHASAAFFQALRAKSQQAGCALILDEVQTGVGITGKLWCHEHFGFVPDLVAFGKKMNMGGCFATLDYDVTQFGRMYQTRNGDRARAIVGLATLETIRDQGLLANAEVVGAVFLSGLQELCSRFPALATQARGRGMILAFDMPTVAVRDDFLKRCLGRGVFASYTGASSVRLRPHLITTSTDAHFALSVFGDVLLEMSQ